MITVVTGASRGIGAAVARRFLAEGATVVALNRSDPDIEGAAWLDCDVADSSQVDAVFASILADHGRVDVVVNNAGVQVEKTIDETTDADFDHVIGVNVRGVFNVARAAVRAMTTGDGGSIINIGSTAARHADRGMAIYNASKGAVASLSRAIAIDHGHQGIRCNVVAPGWIATDMADAAFAAMQDPAAARAQAEGRHPLGRLGTADDVAGLCYWLAGDDAAFATGSVFTLDGGLTAQSPI